MKPIHFLLFALVFSCKSQSQKPKLTDEQMKYVYAQELNNKAIDMASDENKLDSAIKLLDSAIKIFPEYKTAYLNKGKVLLKKDDIDGVLKINEILMIINPLEAGYSIQRAIIHERRGKMDSANHYYQQGLKKYRSYFPTADTAHPPELFMLIEYAEFLSFAGLQKESMERLQQLKNDIRANEAYKKYNLRTKEEWFNTWNYHRDGSDYYKMFGEMNKY